MLRRISTITLVVFLVAPLAAQAPQGWKVRVDRSQSAQDPDDTPDLKFATAGSGLRVTGGPAGTFWNPADSVAGNYTVRGTFTLMKPSPHTNYYGLIFGGGELDSAGQTYTYFIVAQNGMYQVRHRTGEKVQDVKAATAHEAIRRPDSSGQSRNALEVRVAGDTISYVINGMVVHTTPRTGTTAKADGIAGFRINHLLDVQVDGFQVQKS
jgi:hypothetical protein